MECPDCKGKGTLPRAQPTALLPHFGDRYAAFPRLCDRCSGSGEVKAAKPQTEGQKIAARSSGGVGLLPPI
jgi:DnaJ-class molecular chaperone